MTATTTTTDPRFRRALAFERAMHAAVGRVITADWGQAFLHPDIGRCHEENLLWGTGEATKQFCEKRNDCSDVGR